MLLLPLSYIKDAARSVKRICKEQFREVKDSTLTELLSIQALIVTMFALRCEGEYEVLHLWCTHHNDIVIDFHILNFTALSVGTLDDVLQCTTYSVSSLWPCEI